MMRLLEKPGNENFRSSRKTNAGTSRKPGKEIIGFPGMKRAEAREFGSGIIVSQRKTVATVTGKAGTQPGIGTGKPETQLGIITGKPGTLPGTGGRL
jgi:hypothetical protein